MGVVYKAEDTKLKRPVERARAMIRDERIHHTGQYK